MTRHVLLDNISHKNLRIDRRYEPGRGFDYNITRAFPIELGILQSEYPLFFIKNSESGHFEPVALLGFEEGENLYLGGEEWLARARGDDVSPGDIRERLLNENWILVGPERVFSTPFNTRSRTAGK